jgi:predicted RND superfamily exporter protein
MKAWTLRFFALAALAVLVVSGLSRISFNVDILKLLPANLPQVQGLSLFLKHFALPNELIVTLEGPDSAALESHADSLATLLRSHPHLVSRAVSRPPWEQNPSEFSELLAFNVANQSPEKIRLLLDSLSPERAPQRVASTVERLGNSFSAKEIALLSFDPFAFSEALLQGALPGGESASEFSSADGTFRVLYVEAAKPLANYRETLAWLNEIRHIARQWNAPLDLKVGFTGEPAFVSEISSAMEWDMSSSGLSTLLIVGFIFWLCYRKMRPLALLMTLLMLIFVVSLSIAGLFLKQLTVMGVGFASIMIGLSVDYGYFIYQKSLEHSGSTADLLKVCFQNIVWTAGTTAAAFFALNLSSLPGLSQLGNLVGIGVLVGAALMLLVFAPLCLKLRSPHPQPPARVGSFLANPKVARSGFWCSLLLILGLSATLAIKGLPSTDFSSRALRPRHCASQEALEKLQARLVDERALLSLIVEGDSPDQVAQRLQSAEAFLRSAAQKGDAAAFSSPLALWAQPAHQTANLPLLAQLASEAQRLKATAVQGGFTEESFQLTSQILDHWTHWASEPLPVWPSNPTSQWIFRRTVRHEKGAFLALGMVTPHPGRQDVLAAGLHAPGVHLAGWSLLGSQLAQVIPREFLQVFAALVGIVFLILAVGFRGPRDVLLLAANMSLVFVCLAATMSLLNIPWNLFNLAAILLLLGTGIDYSILLILALRENGGNVPDAQRQLGLVILLCAAAAAAGFGSISWANNLGLASLGQTCALGLVLDAVITLFLLPPAWKALHRR